MSFQRSERITPFSRDLSRRKSGHQPRSMSLRRCRSKPGNARTIFGLSRNLLRSISSSVIPMGLQGSLRSSVATNAYHSATRGRRCFVLCMQATFRPRLVSWGQLDLRSSRGLRANVRMKAECRRSTSLIRKSARFSFRSREKVPALEKQSPQKRRCLHPASTTTTPKKPNSALRKVAKVPPDPPASK